MTREEAIKIIRREYSCVDRDCDIERSCGKCPYSMPSKEPILKAYCLAVEALELVTSYEGTINKLTEALNQQTCEDCISREAVGDMLNRIQMKKDDTWYDYYHKALKELSELPPVYPKQKTGHWIGIDEEPHEVWECDHCGFVIDGSGCIDPYDYRDTYKYCPNCGAKMVEPQERSDKK